MPTLTVPREAPATPAVCPFLASVVADRLWPMPRRAYCRRPNGRVRLPGREMADCVCATHAHLLCPAYLAGRAASEADSPRRR